MGRLRGVQAQAANTLMCGRQKISSLGRIRQDLASEPPEGLKNQIPRHRSRPTESESLCKLPGPDPAFCAPYSCQPSDWVSGWALGCCDSLRTVARPDPVNPSFSLLASSPHLALQEPVGPKNWMDGGLMLVPGYGHCLPYWSH